MAFMVVLILSSIIAFLPVEMSQVQNATIAQQSVISKATNENASDTLSTDLLRSQIMSVMKQNQINGMQLATGLQCALYHSMCPAVTPPSWNNVSPPAWAVLLTTPHTFGIATLQRTAQVTDVSTTGYRGWVEFSITENGTLRLKARVDLGLQSSFDNAATGNDFACTFCHVTVYGNVAQYLAPDPAHILLSRIHGSWVSSNITTRMNDVIVTGLNPVLPTTTFDDDSTDRTLDYYGVSPTLNTVSNPSVWEGSAGPTGYYYTLVSRGEQQNYSGPLLPINVIREQQILPKIDPDSSLPLMSGTISGQTGSILVVPYGSSSSPTPMNAINGTYEGNAILNGRDNGPLTISGRVFFRGDVVIFGQIQGNGEIYSGRNIYIADDLTYVNSPPHFSGQQSYNQEMTYVSTPSKAAQIAGEMANYDRVALMAVNNIVIGNPYPEVASTPEVRTDLQYMTQNIMVYDSDYLAQDTATGYMMDVQANPDGSLCFILPWQNPTNCRLAPAGGVPAGVLATPLVQYPNGPAGVSDNAYYNDQFGNPLPVGYSDNFYPKNAVGGGLIDWITEASFEAYTNNPTQVATATGITMFYGPSAGNARNRPKDFMVPIPATDPYDPNTWASGSGMYAQIDGWIGWDSQLGALEADNDDAPGSTSLRTRIQNFFDLCRQAATIGIPRIGFGSPGFTGENATTFTTNLPMFECNFGYSPGLIGALGGTGRTNVDVQTPLTTYICEDDNNYPVGGSVPSRCQLNADGVTPISLGQDIRLRWAAPFGVSVYYEGNLGFPFIRIRTSYWNPTVTPFKNKVKHIQAFLIANQYISYNVDTLSDRRLKIDGGLISKNLLGRFINKLGPERTYTNGYLPTNNGWTVGVDGGDATSLIVMEDPRFQFDTQLMDSRVGRVLLTY